MSTLRHSSFEFRTFTKGIRWESNPCLLVHSQACSDRYTTETISFQQLNQESNPDLLVRSEE